MCDHRSFHTRRNRAARAGSGRSAPSRARPCDAGRVGGAHAGSGQAGSVPHRAAPAAQSPAIPGAHHDRSSPRPSDAPTPDEPWRASLRGSGQRRARAAATAPLEGARRVLWLASTARSVRACRSVHRTSRSTCPTQYGSPRGPRRTQAALRTLLPHPDLDRNLTQRLDQLRTLSLQLLLPRRGPGLTRNQTDLASIKELALPVPDHLPRHLLPTSDLNNQHLTLKHRQHDTDLLPRRDRRRTTHDDSNPSTRALHQQPTTPATKPDARHDTSPPQGSPQQQALSRAGTSNFPDRFTRNRHTTASQSTPISHPRNRSQRRNPQHLHHLAPPQHRTTPPPQHTTNSPEPRNGTQNPSRAARS